MEMSILLSAQRTLWVLRMISSTEVSGIASSDIGKLWVRRTIIKIIKAMANNAGIRRRKRPRVGRVADEIA